jgi:minor extracellular protease Epr
MIILIYLVASQLVEAKTLKIAIVDTGYNFAFKDFKHFGLSKPKLCRTGHKDFTDTSLVDDNGHGSNIASLIAKGNEDTDYCILVLKFYSPEVRTIAGYTETEAINYAISQKVDVLNLSIAGYEYMKEECDAVKKALNAGIKIVAAAGNEKFDLSKINVYPAMCDKRVQTVMNYNKGTRHYTSNYGKNMYQEQGTYMYGLGKGDLPVYMTGTSQAAAVHTGKLIKQMGR